MGGNGRGGRGNGRNRGSGGIYTVDASITSYKTASATDLLASVNGKRFRLGASTIGCAKTTLNNSSLKGSGAGASKTRIETGYVTIVSPVVVMV